MPTSKAQRSPAGATRHVRKTSEVRTLRKLNRDHQTDVFFLLLEVLAGDPSRAVNAAKHLVALPPNKVPIEPLSRIVFDPCYKDWSRIAAAYVLGFLPRATGRHGKVLRQVLSDTSNSSRVRCHAAESLGNLRDPSATEELESRLFDTAESTSVRKWCIYALGEIGSRTSREALQRFIATKPQGVLAKELALAYASFPQERMHEQ